MDNSGPTLRHAARPVVFVTLAVVVLLAARDVAAQPGASADPRQAMPERPTVATHAHAVAPGILELETGFQFQHSSSSSSSWTGPVLFKIGLANHVQLGISPGWLRTTADGHTTSGFGDAVVALKWQLTVDAPVVGDFAIEPSLKLPTGSER